MIKSVFIFIVQFLLFNLKSNANDLRLLLQIRDTTLILFGNSELKIHVFDIDGTNNFIDSKNTAVTFLKNHKLIFRDSVFCNDLRLKLDDFNNDGIKDILIFFDFDVRSNEMYHLYLINDKLKSLTRIKNFEEVKNPEFDKEKNRIECHVASGRNYAAFYRISKSGKLIRLGTMNE